LTTTPYRAAPDLAGQLSRTEAGWASLMVSVARPVPGAGVVGDGAGVGLVGGGVVGAGVVGAGLVGAGVVFDGAGGDGGAVDGLVADGDGALVGEGAGVLPPPVVPAIRNRLSATFQCDAR
jgi:hypothetical protein